MVLIPAVNRFPGLARGPIDHEASSLINVIANGKINMGSVVKIVSPPSGEILPRVEEDALTGDILAYGIVVGGDADGIYGDGTAATGTDVSTLAASAIGQAVVVCTRGRCLARVAIPTATAVAIGSKLAASATAGELTTVAAGGNVVAVMLQDVPSPGVGNTGLDMVAVEVNKMGVL